MFRHDKTWSLAMRSERASPDRDAVLPRQDDPGPLLFRTVGAPVSERMTEELHLGSADLKLLTSAYFLAFALPSWRLCCACLPALLPWLILAGAGSAMVLSYAALADAFPKEVAGRASAALNVLHIGGAFAIQSGLGMAVELCAGHAPGAAYAVAFALNLVPQCLALGWLVLASRATGTTSAQSAAST